MTAFIVYILFPKFVNQLKLGGLEAWRPGSLEAWRLGGLETWRPGSLEAWRL
jgi:hypothetical protein